MIKIVSHRLKWNQKDMEKWKWNPQDEKDD